MDGGTGPWTAPVESLMAAPRKRARPAGTAVATAISLVLHLLFLSSMVVGLRVMRPPPEDHAIEVRLMPPIELPRLLPPAPVPPKAERRTPPPPADLRPRLVPKPDVGPVAPLPIPAPTPAPKNEKAGPLLNPGASDKGLFPSLSGRLGCDNPASFHLTEDQRATCDNHLAERAHAAKQLDIDISDSAKAAFDRNRACHDRYAGGGVPVRGLGDQPSLKECPPSER